MKFYNAKTHIIPTDVLLLLAIKSTKIVTVGEVPDSDVLPARVFNGLGVYDATDYIHQKDIAAWAYIPEYEDAINSMNDEG